MLSPLCTEKDGRELRCGETDTRGSQHCETVGRPCGVWRNGVMGWLAWEGSNSGWVHSWLEEVMGLGALETGKQACHVHPFPHACRPPARRCALYPSARHCRGYSPEMRPAVFTPSSVYPLCYLPPPPSSVPTPSGAAVVPAGACGEIEKRQKWEQQAVESV